MGITNPNWIELLGVKIDSHLVWKNEGDYSNYTHIFKIWRTKLFILIYNEIPKKIGKNWIEQNENYWM